jgi:uncharacterized peroxidase-related enzyme
MQTIKPVDVATATGKNKQIFDGLQRALGTVPNLMKTLGNSPAALNAYMSFNAALGEAKIPAAVREQIALAVANANSCDYCLSAHSALGKLAGLSEADLGLARNAQAGDPKRSAALKFAIEVVRQRGMVRPATIDALREAGYGDGEITEIVAVVAINIFTNYFNHIAGTEIDFPVVHSAH